MDILIPRYLAPNRRLVDGLVPPSPPAERREKRRRIIDREVPTYRKRWPSGIIAPTYEEIRRIEAMRIGTPGAMSGGMSVMSGVETQLLGSNVVPIPPANLVFHIVSDTQIYSDAGSTPVTNGGTVQQWNELVSANNFTQGTSSRRPVYNTNQTNGLPAITLTTTAKRMSSAFTPSGSSNYAFFLIINFLGWTQNNYVYQSGAQVGRELFQNGSSPNLTFYNGSTVSGAFNPASIGTWALLVNTFTSGNQNQYAVNNGSLANMGVSAGIGSGWNGILIGGDNGLDISANISLAEWAIYSPIPTGSAYTGILNYFKARYAYW